MRRITTRRNNRRDEEYHRCSRLVRRHHQAVLVKVGLKRERGEREREKKKEEKVYRWRCGIITNKENRKKSKEAR